MKNVRHQLGPLNCVTVDGGDRPSILVVLCHGFGAPGQDLVPLGQYMLEQMGSAGEDLRFVFPEAPISLADEGMPGGRAWWRLNMQRLMDLFQTNDFSELKNEIPPGIDEARDLLVASVQAAKAATPQLRHLVLGGFSQGAMLAMDTVLREPVGAEALILFSGTLICESIWKENLDRLRDVDVLQSHGTSDFVLPFVGAEWLRDLMDGSAKSLQFIPFPGPHTIPVEAIEGCIRLLKKLQGSLDP